MSKTRLIDAVRRLDAAEIGSILRDDPSMVESVDRSGRNLLHLACSMSCADLELPESAASRIVRLLLDFGVDPESPKMIDGYRCNSVWFAVAKGRNATVAKLLIRNGASPRGLFAAGWHQDLSILRLLVRSGAAVDEVAEDETPFLHCWKSGRFEAAKLLLRLGADPNFQDSKGKSALHYGLDKSYDPSLLRHLVRAGASPDLVDQSSRTPRTLAVRKRTPSYGSLFP